MGKRANPMAVKAALAYDINEAARALGVTPATIRNWIKNGLQVMSSRKPYLILGDAIRTYLREQRMNAKRPLGTEELFCLSCGDARKPSKMAVTTTRIGAQTSLLKGICAVCGSTCTRVISVRDASIFSTVFQIAKGPNSAP